MTDRIHSITLVLDKDMRDDDCEALINACRQLRHVIGVTPNVSDYEVHTGEVRAHYRISAALYEALQNARKNGDQT
jgi:hypothetical protein